MLDRSPSISGSSGSSSRATAAAAAAAAAGAAPAAAAAARPWQRQQRRQRQQQQQLPALTICFPKQQQVHTEVGGPVRVCPDRIREPASHSCSCTMYRNSYIPAVPCCFQMRNTACTSAMLIREVPYPLSLPASPKKFSPGKKPRWGKKPPGPRDAESLPRQPTTPPGRPQREHPFGPETKETHGFIRVSVAPRVPTGPQILGPSQPRGGPAGKSIIG